MPIGSPCSRPHTSALSRPSPILITGASGLVGSALIHRLHEAEPDRPIHVLTRRPTEVQAIAGCTVKAFGWSPSDGHVDPDALLGVDHIIHLAGEPVAQRWTPATRVRIRESRTKALNLLKQVCETAHLAPRIISASAVGLYGHSADLMTEHSPPGEGFLADVVKEWEDAAADLGSLGGGHVTFRIGLVLSAKGGVLERLLPIYRCGLGAPLASGKQFQSWIHIDDLVGLLMAALAHPEWHGPYNAVAPEAVSQREFSRTLAGVLNRPHFFPNVPAAALRLWFGEAAEALLASHKVRPERLLEAGYSFEFSSLEKALFDAISA